VFLGVAWLLEPEKTREIFCEFKEFYWLISVFVSLIGVAIYAVHQNAVVRVLFLFIVLIQRLKKRDFPAELKEESPNVVIRRIEEERWLRRSSGNSGVKMIQSTLDSWASLMNFLYCSSYSLMVLPLFIKKNSYWKLTFFSGLFLFLVAFQSDYRITWREILMIKKCP